MPPFMDRDGPSNAAPTWDPAYDTDLFEIPCIKKQLEFDRLLCTNCQLGVDDRLEPACEALLSADNNRASPSRITHTKSVTDGRTDCCGISIETTLNPWWTGVVEKYVDLMAEPGPMDGWTYWQWMLWSALHGKYQPEDIAGGRRLEDFGMDLMQCLSAVAREHRAACVAMMRTEAVARMLGNAEYSGGDPDRMHVELIAVIKKAWFGGAAIPPELLAEPDQVKFIAELTRLPEVRDEWLDISRRHREKALERSHKYLQELERRRQHALDAGAGAGAGDDHGTMPRWDDVLNVITEYWENMSNVDRWQDVVDSASDYYSDYSGSSDDIDCEISDYADSD
ncbi:hypothetical protein B0T19DRAFT_459768 [Cercophora scortea]|uniref:Uncharacterized protein n=1 Tax=Cercophora scortea TaxID=314031 RepID=A0AAE0MIX5_9PEZI|nr:hypothetical protein B0T19DRAFT_459768 [Cercophora scortea]